MGKKKRRRGKQTLELPEDLIADIISRVPDKDLMRFTCVSKSWRSLINTTDSHLSQLRSQRTTSLDLPFLIIQEEKYVPGGQLYYNYRFELDSIEDGNPKPREIHNPFDHDHDNPRRDARVIASCEGLLVLQQRPSRKMVLLNPTTKERHVVPPNPAGDSNVVFIGFGYDRVHGSYKLVTETKHPSRDDRVLELMIHNVGNCTWKKSRFDGLDHDSYHLLYEAGKCVDGALYWCEEIVKKMLCFLLAEEEFHMVDLPDFDEVMYKSFVTVFDGRLCFGCEGAEDRAELWLMECNYKRQLGSLYSWRWIKFLSILEPQVQLHPCISPDLIPICFSACENKILFYVAEGRLFWYDLGKNKFRKLKNRINELGYRNGRVHVTSCVPRLVGIGMSRV